MSDSEVAAAQAMMSSLADATKMYVNLDLSEAYCEFRPRYIEELFKTIADYCKETTPGLHLAVDVGCGPGMSTLGFCKFFEKVIGVDVSETQIACAPKDVLNCEFRIGYSHNLPFIESGTVDLFCAGQSFHFMPHREEFHNTETALLKIQNDLLLEADQGKVSTLALLDLSATFDNRSQNLDRTSFEDIRFGRTFAEADRVLRPGGTIALFGYSLIKSPVPEINGILQEFLAKFMPYCSKSAVSGINKVRDIALPYPEHTRKDDLHIYSRISVEECIGYFRSTWPFWAFSKDHPEIDVARELRKELEAVLVKVNAPGDTTFDVTFDLYIAMGRKPKTTTPSAP